MSFLKVRIAGVWKVVDFANVFKVRVAGAWKNVTFLRVYETTGNPPQSGWRNVWSPGAPPAPPAPVDPPVVPPPVTLNVTIDPASVFGSKRTTGVVTTSVFAVASVSNGTGPYTYVWTPVAWDILPTILTPNVNSTKFSMNVPTLDVTKTARFKCFVQDSLGNTGSAEVPAEFITVSREDWTPGGGGGVQP